MFALGGFGFGAGQLGGTMLIITILAFGVTTLFSLVTLPVEFDASKRALVWLNDQQIVNQSEYGKAKEALKWTEMTYVAATIRSLDLILYLIMQITRRN